MSLVSFFKRRWLPIASTKPKSTRRTHPARLRCEFLEDRSVPAAFTGPELLPEGLNEVSSPFDPGSTGLYGATNLNELTASKASPMSRMSSSLISLYSNYLQASTLTPNQTFTPSDPNLLVRDGYVAVDATAQGNVQSLIEELESIGATGLSSFGRVVSAWLPFEALPQMGDLNSLRFARSVFQPVTSVGATTSQADAAVRADEARTNFGVDGSGVTIGVLSDSFDTGPGSYVQDQATGDLPPDIDVLQDLPGGSDEGRAMLQLIYDLAPGADLSFATAFGGQANFANNILALAEAGADIIVDDVIYFAEPMFQDGIVAQAVNQVADDGVAYFSSAGNSGRDSYESGFRSSGDNIPNIGELHDFDPGSGVDAFQSVTVPVGGSFTLSFQWDQPFISAGGAGSASDYDIYLVTPSGQIVASSTDNNLGNDAVELLSFQNNGQLGTQFNLVISRFSGPDAGLMKYVYFGDLTINEYDTKSSTVYGHANAAGANAVGAAFYQDTPEFGVSPAELEDFSSAGGTPIFFNTAGQRLSQPDVRNNPDFVAPDGTNTTFFGTDVDGDSFPNFFGTSAAAPHAAAVAALLLEANPDLTPQEITSVLAETAQDIGPEGVDFDSGAGLIDALAAVEAVSSGQDDPPPPPPPPQTGDLTNGGFEDGLTGFDTLGDVFVSTTSFGETPVEGNNQATLTNSNANGGNLSETAIESFLELPSGSLESVTVGSSTAGSALGRSVFIPQGATLRFAFNFLTNEGTPSSFNDSALFTISGPEISQAFLLADTTTDGFSVSNAAFTESTGYFTAELGINQAGDYTIGFVVLDGRDTAFDSALLIDAIEVVPATDLNNQSPQAINDVATVNEDTATNINVLANDFDPDGDPLTVTFAEADNGSVTITPSGLTYQPDPDFNGQDTILYTISDGNEASSTATVSITVNPVNDVPIANDDTATVDQGSTANLIDVLANDLDPDGDLLSLNTASAQNGTVTFSADSGIRYTPNPTFRGTDTITYTVSDGNGGSATAQVIVTVEANLGNGGFENGLSGFEAQGDVRIVDGSFGVDPVQGSQQALLTTANNLGGNQTDGQLEQFLGLTNGSIDSLVGGNATAGSALRTTLTVEAGDTLTIRFNFLTNEATPSSFNDTTFLSVAGEGGQQLFRLADTTTPGFQTTPASFNAATGYQEVTLTFNQAGTYTIGFGVVDLGDTTFDSALLLDGLELN